jgi:hypothetical protein
MYDEAGITFIGVSGFFELTSDEIIDGVSVGENSMDSIESGRCFEAFWVVLSVFVST